MQTLNAPFNLRDKKKQKAVSLKPKHVLEGLFAQTLSDCYSALNVFYASTAPLSDITDTPLVHQISILPASTQIKGLFNRVFAACADMLKNSSMFGDRSLNARHRATRKLISDFVIQLIEVHQAYVLGYPKCSNDIVLADDKLKYFFKDLVCFLLAFHNCLTANNDHRDRANIAQEMHSVLESSRNACTCLA